MYAAIVAISRTWASGILPEKKGKETLGHLVNQGIMIIRNRMLPATESQPPELAPIDAKRNSHDATTLRWPFILPWCHTVSPGSRSSSSRHGRAPSWCFFSPCFFLLLGNFIFPFPACRWTGREPAFSFARLRYTFHRRPISVHCASPHCRREPEGRTYSLPAVRKETQLSPCAHPSALQIHHLRHMPLVGRKTRSK